MPFGYFTTVGDADDYFNTERSESGAWVGIADEKKKESLLTGAYNRLFYNSQWNLPTLAAATAAQLIILKKANAEMAYYMAIHLNAEDRRKGIQAQAVIKAGIVKEDYFAEMIDNVPIPAFIKDLLAGFAAGSWIGLIDIGRDEDKSVSEKIDNMP